MAYRGQAEVVADNQNWRLKTELGASRTCESVRMRLTSGERAVPTDVVVTHDDATLFAYAASEASLRAAKRAIEALSPRSESVVSHWDDELDDWVQVDPPLAGDAKRRQQAVERSAEHQETRTLVCSAGRLVRREIEQSMQESAHMLRLDLAIREHPHLLTCQVLFEVTGPKHKIDEFAEVLNSEEMATLRAERAVMLSPL